MSPSEHRTIDAVIFDMGNVLIDWTPARLIRHFTDDDSVIDLVLEQLFRSAPWKALDQGVITENQVIEQVCATLPTDLHSLIEKVVTRWPEANVIDPRMEALAKRLHQTGIRLYLGSNASLRFHTYSADIKALNYFDGLQISAEVKVSKPDPQFFEILVKTFRLDPLRTGFIDDLEKNCLSAATLGIQTHHYTNDFDALVKQLIAWGALPHQTTVEEILRVG